MRRKYMFLMLALVAALVAGCEDDGPDIDIESAIPVSVETVESKPIQEYAFATGTVLATRDAALIAEQAGYYKLQTNPRTKRKYAMGDQVRAGEVVVLLDNRELENQVMIDSKRLNLEISQRELEQQKNLYDKGGVTLRELTDAERTYIDAQYSYDNAKLQLDKLKVKAPFDGILVDLIYYTPGQLLAAGVQIAQVTDYRKLYCEFSLPGSEMSRVQVDQTTLVTNYTSPEDTLLGVISQVSPALDPTSRMFKVSAMIDNDSLILRPGMFVRVDVVVASKDSAIVIPQDIVLSARGAKRVFIIDKGIAVERKIETGLSNPLQVEVISGVKAGDRLVVKGYETLRNRSKVRVLK